jgi:ATP-binding cassette subfamily F protein 3
LSFFNKKVQRKQDAERRKKLKPLYDALKKADKALEKHHQQQKGFNFLRRSASCLR